MEQDKIVEESNSKKQNLFAGKKMFYWGLGVGILVIIILIAGVFSYRALAVLATDRATLAVARAIGLPAGFVGGRRVLYSDFAEDVPAVNRFYESQLAKNPGATVPTPAEIKKSVWDRLVKNALVGKMAEEKNIKVTKKEVDDEYGSFAEGIGSPEKAAALVEESYGWSPEQFKNKIIKQFLLQSKLAGATSTVEFLESSAKKKAEEVLAAIKEGKKSFEELAGQYGEDGTKDKGGDLGWFGEGEMVPEFEEAVAKMEAGETSELVKSRFGFHIIRLNEKKTEKGKEKWRASHILSRALSFDEYLANLEKKTSVWKWIKI